MLTDFWSDLSAYRVYPSDLLGWQPTELLALCVPFLLLAAVLWLLGRPRRS